MSLKKIVCDFKRCSLKTILMPREATSVLNWMLEEILISLFYAREIEEGFFLLGLDLEVTLTQRRPSWQTSFFLLT